MGLGGKRRERMKVGIMQPYFFPYLGYWQLIHYVDTYVVFDDVNYINRGWIARNNFLIGNAPKMISIPLVGASQTRLINSIELTESEKERDSLIRTIELAYRKAPYFGEIMPMVTGLIKNCRYISELNYKAILAINQYLGIDTRIVLSSQLEKDCDLKGQDKIVDICKRLGADVYINAIGGTELYSREVFNNQNMQLQFLKMDENISYKQFGGDFVKGLSIIDVLMFNSKPEVLDLLKRFELVNN